MSAEARTALQAEYYELTREWRALVGERKRALKTRAPADPTRDARIATLVAARNALVDKIRDL